jgi:acetyl-CoA C-acetyltransferase
VPYRDAHSIQDNPVVIVQALRTPMGAFQGVFAQCSAPELGAYAIRAVYEQAGLKPDQIDEVLMGCVLSAGLGQAPARQAALKAGLPNAVPCTTVNKMCGSGMKTIMLAYDALLAAPEGVIIAGGQENMTQAPYLVPKARAGLRLGHAELKDHLFLDGLEDAYERGQLMGVFAERTAQQLKITRDQQDAFAVRSCQRAIEATQQGFFKSEIVPVGLPSGNIILQDEPLAKINFEKIKTLKPAFSKHPEATVTAANASSIADGAAAVLMMRFQKASSLGLKPQAIIRGHASFAMAPEWFTVAPEGAIRRCLEKVQWDVASVDLFEINEAFAVVTLATMQALDLPVEKVNIHGGACALGHPIGASGARIVATLVSALRRQRLKRGIAALCIGGGEAVALGIECCG